MDDDDRFRPLSDDEREQAAPARAGGSAKDDDDWDLIVPVPDTVPAPDMHHWTLGEPVASWIYRDANGGRICFIGRYNKADGDKEFRPRTLVEKPRYRKGGVALEERSRSASALRARTARSAAQRPGDGCRGREASADVARRIFPDHVVVSPMNGAKSPQQGRLEPAACA